METQNISFQIGDKVKVDKGTPGTCGYKPNISGKIVGFIIKLDKPIPGEEVGEYQLDDTTHIQTIECNCAYGQIKSTLNSSNPK